MAVFGGVVDRSISSVDQDAVPGEGHVSRDSEESGVDATHRLKFVSNPILEHSGNVAITSPFR